MKLIINKIPYKIKNEEVDLFFSFEDNGGTKRKISNFIDGLTKKVIKCPLELQSFLINSYDKKIAHFYFTFKSNERSIKINLQEYPYFIKFYVKEQLVHLFQDRMPVSESFTSDLSVFMKENKSDVDGWEKYKVFNLLIARKTIALALGSSSTYISKRSYCDLEIAVDKVSYLLNDNYVRHIKECSQNEVEISKVLANRDIKTKLGIPFQTTKLNYTNYYKDIERFFETKLKKNSGNISFYESGFTLLKSDFDIKQVDKTRSELLFKDRKKNVNASNGMKNNGPFKEIGDKKKMHLQFIFIYKDSNDANTLFKFFKNGYKHFPGLESYVGVPIVPSQELKLQYKSIENFKADFENYLSTKLNEENYSDKFAIFISPYGKDDGDEEKSEIYYYVKESFLKKGIPSQVIVDHKIHSNNFHFSLPNIAIAILAKLGGIPWRLARENYDELIIGFGSIKTRSGKYIGNTVFFNNSGEIQKVSILEETNDLSNIGKVIKSSILQYLKQTGETPNRIILHYYKPPSSKEVKAIRKSLMDLGIDIPFIIVEINDTKAKDFLCFDQDFNMGMPKSGTIVNLNVNEFLLFNNARYEDRPASYITEEYPIKVRIQYVEGERLDENSKIILIDQIYEFSRIYWKSLRQQSHPVTVKYSKMIATYISQFHNHSIPSSSIAEKTTWFI